MGQENAETNFEPRLPTVLVVDDEVLVRLVIAEYLRDCGYRAHEAANAAEAIKVLEANLDVDVLFTDVEMPGEKNGFGLVRWAREHRKGLKVLITSGNPSKAHEARDLCLDENFVGKPVSFDDLHDRMKWVLASVPEA